MAKNNLTASIGRVFTENLHLKILSLLIAIFLWAIVSGERNAEWSYLLPLEKLNQPEALIITNNIPNFLDVRLQGPHSFIKNLNPKNMAINLDLGELKVGSNIYPLTADLVNTPRGATITRINPSYITIEAEKLMRKKVNIKADIKGTPAKDFFIETIELIPSVMEIIGAESEAKEVGSLKTIPVQVEGIKSDIQFDAAVDTRGRKIILTSNDPVRVNISIKEVMSKLEIKGVMPEIINASYKTTLKPGKVNIRIEGPKSLVAKLGESGVRANVNVSGLRPGVHKKEVELILPEGVRLLQVYPKTIKIKISKIKL
ncbi:MAG: CdaR family protein [Deltaproteobacteria bacterium]|nr:CdaR family protein [Deltaproteobacteria bacterium]